MLGDGAHAVFDEPSCAVDAALQLQQALSEPGSTGNIRLSVRSGLHWGNVEHRDNDFFGTEVNRAARIAGVAYGGQVLLSQAVANRIEGMLPAGTQLLDLGDVRLKGMANPERVYQVVHPQLRRDFPPLRSLETAPNNLPQNATSFIGRATEIEEICELLERSRLLTLIGFGGLGKTRLALQVGRELLGAFRDGVWIVDLTPIRDPALVQSEIAKALSVRAEPGRPPNDAICAHLRVRSLLLILDNCEHLLTASAQIVHAIVQASPYVRVLATSREPLNIHGEQRYSLSPFPVPDITAGTAALSCAPAVWLFVERAQLCRPGFSLSDHNAAAVAELVGRLEGIPLAIELAAARMRSLTVQELNRRIADRFRVLTSETRMISARQQSLRAVIDWSYDLLNERERECLCRISVFAGGWTLDAAEAVCGGEGVHDHLVALVDKSLITADERDGTMRYRMLETVREYARERLRQLDGEAEARGRHLTYFRTLGEEAEPHLRGSEQVIWLSRVESERDNIAEALTWSAHDGDAESGLRLACAISWYWYVRGYLEEGRAWICTLLDAVQDAPAALRAKALSRAGLLTSARDAAGQFAEQSLAIYRELGDRDGIATSLINLGSSAAARDDSTSARALYEESLAIFRSLRNRAASAVALTSLANLATREHDLPSARALLDECLGIWRELRHDWGTANCLNALGGVAYDESDYATAHARYEESLRIRRTLGDRSGIADSLNGLGNVARVRNDYSTARSLHEQSLAISTRLDDAWNVINSLEGLAAIAAGENLADRVALILGAIEALCEEKHISASVRDPSLPKWVDSARSALGDAAFETAWRAGRAMTQERAIQYALEQGGWTTKG
jgi:predicted ATPase